MRLLTWERYVPDVEDNRARHAAGGPALVVEVRPPTAKVWMAFRRAVLADADARETLLKLMKEYGEHGALRIVSNEERFGALLWLPCVGHVVSWPSDWGPAPADGAGLWALRDALDSGELYVDIFRALFDRAELEAGLAVPLASGSGPRAAQTPDPVADGTAATAAVTA